MIPQLGERDALILVDVQRDFCPGGALAVPAGDAIVPALNRWIAVALDGRAQIYATRDWHPPEHPSFTAQGGPWPVHCVQGTPGAEFHPGLRLPPRARILVKGVRFDRDQLSAFAATGLAAALGRQGVRRLWVGGLALEVCVRNTVLDGLQAGFAVHLIGAGTRPIDAAAGEQALAEMHRAGAHLGAGALQAPINY